MKRIINGYEVDWASERVFAERQTAPNYGYLFEVSADRKRIERCAHISAIGGDSDNLDGDAERVEKDARQAVEEFLGCQRESGGLLGGGGDGGRRPPEHSRAIRLLRRPRQHRGCAYSLTRRSQQFMRLAYVTTGP